jgi:hypothetical protein
VQSLFRTQRPGRDPQVFRIASADDAGGNYPPLEGIFPDKMAPILSTEEEFETCT